MASGARREYIQTSVIYSGGIFIIWKAQITNIGQTISPRPLADMKHEVLYAVWLYCNFLIW